MRVSSDQTSKSLNVGDLASKPGMVLEIELPHALIVVDSVETWYQGASDPEGKIHLLPTINSITLGDSETRSALDQKAAL